MHALRSLHGKLKQDVFWQTLKAKSERQQPGHQLRRDRKKPMTVLMLENMLFITDALARGSPRQHAHQVRAVHQAPTMQDEKQTRYRYSSTSVKAMQELHRSLEGIKKLKGKNKRENSERRQHALCVLLC